MIESVSVIRHSTFLYMVMTSRDIRSRDYDMCSGWSLPEGSVRFVITGDLNWQCNGIITDSVNVSKIT